MSSLLSLSRCFRFCHNLDSATSGILVIAKNRNAAAECVEVLSNRQAAKEYAAIVFGHIENPEHIVDLAIAKKMDDDFRMEIVAAGGKPAQTVVKVDRKGWLGIAGPNYGVPVTKVHLKPITGRRHQLR